MHQSFGLSVFAIDHPMPRMRWTEALGSDMKGSACHLTAMEKRRKWNLFGIGLAVRLIGVLLIWLGDGHDSVFRKSLVVLGLILSIGGIGILRYLLVSGFRRKK